MRKIWSTIRVFFNSIDEKIIWSIISIFLDRQEKKLGHHWAKNQSPAVENQLEAKHAVRKLAEYANVKRHDLPQ